MSAAKNRRSEFTYSPPLMTKEEIIEALNDIPVIGTSTVQCFTNLRGHITKIKITKPQEPQ